MKLSKTGLAVLIVYVTLIVLIYFKILGEGFFLFFIPFFVLYALGMGAFGCDIKGGSDLPICHMVEPFVAAAGYIAYGLVIYLVFAGIEWVFRAAAKATDYELEFPAKLE